MATPGPHAEPSPPYWTAVSTYISFALLFVFGHLRDFWRHVVASPDGRSVPPPGYAPLLKSYEDFYTRRLYARIHDCFNRPISGPPGAWVDVVERERAAGRGGAARALVPTAATRTCLNLGSYNYLGFAAHDAYCTERVLATLHQYGASTCSGASDLGTTRVHAELEREVAAFVGKPAALVFGMGFATNSLTLPALTRAKGTLLISDALNHSSIVAGARGDVAGGRVRVFRHNDPAHLERVLRAAIAEGQPRTRRPWSKILVVVEGIYSMEGQLCRLAEIVEIKKRYKAYLYLDEAHSIGAMGAGGRGVTEALGVDPADVDVMMGTFTKSFGSCGGYVAGDEALISYLRSTSPVLHATTMSPPSAQQALSALRVISGADGTGRGAGKLAALRDNANFFRDGLAALGCDVLGDRDSPVCPLMLYNPAKIPAFSRACLERHLAVVVVGFPATPLLLSRTRFCVSASHTRDDLAAALAVIADIVGALGLRYGSARPRPAAEGKGAAGWGGGGAAGAALAAAPAEGGRAAAAAAAGGAGGGALANGHAKHA